MPKKWDQDGTPSGKVLEQFTILFFNNKAYSLNDLIQQEMLNVSKPTVIRLIKKLDRAHICNIQREKRGREAFFSITVQPSFQQ